TLPVKVSYTTYALTAGSSNYTTTSGIVSFAAGVTSQNVTVPILNDRIIDPTRRFSLELISASGGAWLGSQLSSVVSILDTNTPPNFTGQPVILPNGNFQFQTLCSTGLVLTVEYSTNLSDWQPLQTFTNATTVTTITDTNATGRLKTFYRVAVP
ncbi:MAG TPA: Calx-beta domain-containing protein, partial [Candidatus Limnocylindrales bacterium]|nr:Calx-beta domain-containing protein [Candidatus Limnocylindrales bacterium]